MIKKNEQERENRRNKQERESEGEVKRGRFNRMEKWNNSSFRPRFMWKASTLRRSLRSASLASHVHKWLNCSNKGKVQKKKREKVWSFAKPPSDP